MSLHLILGPMFSGKSTRLINHIRTFTMLEYTVFIIKPDIDKRYTTLPEICTHDQMKHNCHMVPMDAYESILDTPEYKKANVVMIEEGQFFVHIYKLVRHMLDIDKKRIFVTALNGDSQRELFGDIYKLLPLCHTMELLQALCMQCKDGTPAVYSKRKLNFDQQIQVAGNDVYEAVCGKHFI
jgi:thymidine kinase